MKMIIERVRETLPLIHCITNYVTVNDVANVILACGGRPVMASASCEVEEITTAADGLVLNLGTPDPDRITAMLLAGKKANALGHPVVFDPVGVGASGFRKEAVGTLLKEISFSAICGNISEMKTIAGKIDYNAGVDADPRDEVKAESLTAIAAFAKELSRKTGAAIIVTGGIDVVADAQEAYAIYNGHAMMSKVTGTGCMLTGMLAAFLTADPNRELESVLTAVAAMGYAGELAAEKTGQIGGGTGTFHMCLIDAISQMKDDVLKEGKRVEKL